MKKTFAMCFIIGTFFILLLTSCSKKSAELTEQVYTVAKPAEQPVSFCEDNLKNNDEEGIDCGGKCIPCQNKGIFTEQHLKALIEKHHPGQKITLLYTRNAEPTKKGDALVFPIAVQSQLIKPKTFRIGAKFIQARNMQNSLIETKNDLLDKWINKAQADKTYYLQKADINYTYVKFNVGDVIDERGTAPLPGNYLFHVIVYYYDEPVWQEYDKKEISIFIK